MSVAEILAPLEELAPTQRPNTPLPWISCTRGSSDPTPKRPGTAWKTTRSATAGKIGPRWPLNSPSHDILFQGREARFVLAVDVTERDKLNQELFHRAQHDALTGLSQPASARRPHPAVPAAQLA